MDQRVGMEGDREPQLKTMQDLLDKIFGRNLDGWITRSMMEESGYSLIRVEVGDDCATGAFSHNCDLLVPMIEPFPGLTAEERICREDLAPRETLAQACARKAERWLRDMLIDGRWIESQRHVLARDIDRLNEELREEEPSDQGISDEEFQAARRALQACLRSGMSAGSYRRRLRELKRRRSMAWSIHGERELEIRLQRVIEARLGRRVTCLDQWIPRIEPVKWPRAALVTRREEREQENRDGLR